MKHVRAILWKQLKDLLKNKETLIQYVMFPVITIVMENAIKIEGMPEHFFANMFAAMYIGMASLTSMAAIIAEEKEKNTLRVLQLSNVKAAEYLLGNALYIWTVCMLGSVVIGVSGGYRGTELVKFLGIMALGHLCSTIVGATIGVISKSQMQATSLTVPVMLVLAFLPMLSMFNESIGKVARFVYSQQFSLMINEVADLQIGAETIVVLLCNLFVIIGAFAAVYKKNFS